MARLTRSSDTAAGSSIPDCSTSREIAVAAPETDIWQLPLEAGTDQAALFRQGLGEFFLDKLRYADAAQTYQAFPFALEGGTLRVALSDPLSNLAIEALEDDSGLIIEPYQALRDQILWSIATHYPELNLAVSRPEDQDGGSSGGRQRSGRRASKPGSGRGRDRRRARPAARRRPAAECRQTPSC